MSKARLILYEKQVEEDASIIEVKIWSVPPSTRQPHGVKYSLVYIHAGHRVLGYDNAHGHHHRHYMGSSQRYAFKNMQNLLRDFSRDLNRIKQEERK
jgi:hypothetical protein